jgi:hypothetical protein
VNRTETEHLRSTALDALAIIAAAERGDMDSARALAGTYDPSEMPELIDAIVANAVCCLRAAATYAGLPVSAFLGGVFAQIRAEQ